MSAAKRKTSFNRLGSRSVKRKLDKIKTGHNMEVTGQEIHQDVTFFTTPEFQTEITANWPETNALNDASKRQTMLFLC